jgi:DNA polymerase-3 subunit gamma/tau
MSYLVMARKYRPMGFGEVVDQKHVTTTLINAINSKRIAHAYLFSGPRGTGKTTVARILAKALNCDKGPTSEPCNQCSACEEINAGRSIDVFEMDAASKSRVEDIRELIIEGVKYAPVRGKYKVYIIDEVQMLSDSAFDALLKTIEEPPANVVFIFATTSPQDVPPTILSRCQRFDFKRIPFNDLVETINDISKKEDLEMEKEAVYTLARKADGSLRDCLTAARR